MSTLSLSSSTNIEKQETKDMQEELTNSAKREKEEAERTSEGSTGSSSPTDSLGEEEESEEEEEYDEEEDGEELDDEEESDNEAALEGKALQDSEDEFWQEEPEEGEKELLTILTREQVVQRQLAMVESVAAELGKDMWDTALLLQHFNWNLDRLHTKFWDNPARLMRASGIYLSPAQEAELGGAGQAQKKKRRKKRKAEDSSKPKKKKKASSDGKKDGGKKKKLSAKQIEEGAEGGKRVSSKKSKDKSPQKKKSNDDDGKKKGSKREKKGKESKLKESKKRKKDSKKDKKDTTGGETGGTDTNPTPSSPTTAPKTKSPHKGIKLKLSSRLTKIRSSDRVEGKRSKLKDNNNKKEKLSRKERRRLKAERKNLTTDKDDKGKEKVVEGEGDSRGAAGDNEPGSVDRARMAREREKEEQDKEPLPIPPAGDTSWMELDAAECLVCCDEAPRDELYSLPCKHGPYCMICWGYHVGVAVQNSGAVGILNLTCMWPNCPIKLTYDSYKRLASPEDFSRYLYFWTKNYVDNNKDFSACPNPSCTNVIYFSGTGKPALLVKCTCGHQFCFACGMENHNPVTCDQLDKWQQRNSDDQESLKLIMATTKRCFHCGIPTTRTDGCNHMTCRKEQGGCGGQWCWMCRGDWKTHGPHTGGFYSCNKYDTSDAKKQDDEAAKLKEESDRYLHYFERFFAHSTASKNIQDQLEKAEKKALEYASQYNTNADFFVEAVKLLARCRHILKYTHVYGYYLPDGSKGKDFFEYLQANAEGITERLADMVNAPLSELNIPDFKNRIRVTNEYINNLVRAMEDGLGVEGLGQMK